MFLGDLKLIPHIPHITQPFVLATFFVRGLNSITVRSITGVSSSTLSVILVLWLSIDRMDEDVLAVLRNPSIVNRLPVMGSLTLKLVSVVGGVFGDKAAAPEDMKHN